MQRTIVSLLLFALAFAATADDAAPPQPPPLIGASPQKDGIPTYLVMDSVFSYIGSTAPKSSDLFYFMSLTFLVHADMGSRQVAFTAAADLAAVGAYNDYAMQHGVSQGRIFFTDFLALAPMCVVMYRSDRDGGAAETPRSGLYLRPLPTERGAELGYHWSF